MSGGDIRDTGIAVSDAKRLNDCYHELSEAFAARPAVQGDDEWLSRRLQIFPDTPDGREAVHRSNSQEVAERYIRGGMFGRRIPFWIRTESAEEQVDWYAIVTLTHRTLTTGLYFSDNHPMGYLEFRPLWVKNADWRAFFDEVMAERYPEEAPIVAASAHFRAAEKPDDEIVAMIRTVHA